MSPVRKPRKLAKLALLVGSNPLPNFLAFKVLRPNKVLLLYSPQTRKPMERLCAMFNGVEAEKVYIEDVTSVRSIRDACRNLKVDHLHYSGGTKTMAAHVRMSLDLKDKQASYLDERKGLLRFDDGYDISLDKYDLDLTLEVLLKLHGIERKNSEKVEQDDPTQEDAASMAQAVLNDPNLVNSIYDELHPQGRVRKFKDAKREPWEPNIKLSVSKVPEQSWVKTQYKRWVRFLCGTWLEEWTAGLLRRILGKNAVTVDVGVHCRREQGSEFEIDVALVRGHRLYVISCTTAQKKALCKSKLFEVAMRARQMGGDLARSALVCLLHGEDSNGPYVEQLRSDIAGLWDAPNVPRVFGLEDLREWEGIYGDPNLGSLKEWLES